MKLKYLLIVGLVLQCVIAPLHTQAQTSEPTVDQGWVPILSGTKSDLYSLAVINKDTIFVAGQIVLRSTNGGLSWDSLALPGDFGSVRFINDTTGFLLPYTSTSSYHVLKTTDCGGTWKEVAIGIQAGRAYQMSFPAADTGYVYGNLQVATTHDKGQTWGAKFIVSSPLTMSWADARHGYLMGSLVEWARYDQQASFERTSDGGATWHPARSYLRNEVYGVCAVTPDTLMAVGAHGLIARAIHASDSAHMRFDTLPGGSYGEFFEGIAFPDAAHGTIVGSDGSILRSTDGGLTWMRQQSGTNNRLIETAFVDSSTGFAVGQMGTILKTTNGGLSWMDVLNGGGSSVKLRGGQNGLLEVHASPSPAVSASVLTYDLPSAQRVTIDLYEVTGTHIATILENRMQAAGANSVTVDVSLLPSGTYVYKIQGETCSGTGKLLVTH